MEKSIELAHEILKLEKVCDKSKLQDIELERLKKITDMARLITDEAIEYKPDEDDKAWQS